MNLIKLFCFTALLGGLSSSGISQTTSLRSLEVSHTQGDNTVAATTNVAIGDGNDIYATSLLTIGNLNSIQVQGSGIFVVGTSNFTVDQGLASTAVIGELNEIGDVSIGLIAGKANTADNGTESFILGTNNYTRGRLAFAVGKGLILESGDSASLSSIVLGNYNETPPIGEGLRVLTVANGIDADNPSDAFIVYGNGDVKVPKRQGDVGMGRFGNTADQ